MRATTIFRCGSILILGLCQTACRREAARAGAPAAVDPDCPPPKNLSWARSSTVPELAKKLASSDRDRRLVAALGLAEYGCAAAPAVPALTRALRDSSDDVRRSAAIALGRIGPRASGAVPALIDMLQDRDPPTRPKAARALTQISPEAVRQTMVRIHHEDYPYEIRSMTVMVFIEDWPMVVPGLLRWLEDEKDPRLRGVAALTLGEMNIRAPSATPALLEQLVRGLIRSLAGDPDPEVRARCATAFYSLHTRPILGRDEDGVYQLIHDDKEPMPTVMRALARAIGDPSPEVRDAAVGALGSYYCTRNRDLVRPPIERARNDPDKAVRASVRLKLERFRDYDEREAKARMDYEDAQRR